MNIVQIVGGPGSGKTTLAYKLLTDWPGTASLLRIDRYLRNRQPGDGDDFFLLPTSIDWPLLKLHLGELTAGRTVIVPRYDWKQARRLTLEYPIASDHILTRSEWLIIEGLYYVPDVEAACLFVDAPPDVRRDRARTLDTSLSQSLQNTYDSVVEPVYRKYILPQRELADLVLDGKLPPDQLADRARQYLATHWAGWG